MNYTIYYSSNAGSAETYMEISEQDINKLQDCVTPVCADDIRSILPELYSKILKACQKQEDDCRRSGLYDTEEYQNYDDEDFIVNDFHVDI